MREGGPCGRAVPAGDAAHAHSPAGGQGANKRLSAPARPSSPL
ncbi:FAD-dependent monooxygenase [Streptosporangium roseum]